MNGIQKGNVWNHIKFDDDDDDYDVDEYAEEMMERKYLRIEYVRFSFCFILNVKSI